MKRLFCTCIAAASLLSATAYAGDSIYAPESEFGSSSDEYETIVVPYETGWRPAFSVKAGVGPAIDLRDPCFGYSARFGIDFHAKYWGVGLEVTWNTVWSNASPSRPYLRRDFADKTSNSGLIVLGHGYLPTSDRFILSLGAGIGLGARYEDFSDNPEEKRNAKMMDASWLARIQTGALWLVTDNFTVGFDIEFNFGNYLSELPRWNSDDALDISLAGILTFSYQFFFY